MFKTVKLKDAVGLVLAHDVTEIRQGEFKGRAFKKGHRVRHKDLCHLQRLGKEHLFVLTLEEGYLHENDAAIAMARAFCGPNVGWEDEPREGKLNLVALVDGLLKVHVGGLTEINMLGDVMCATRHTNTLVKKGAVVAGTRAIPLVIKAADVEAAVAKAKTCGGVLEVKPLRRARVGLVITGNEVFTRLIEDRFESILRKKVDHIGSEVIGVAFAPDKPETIASEIRRLIEAGADLILTTGGMSVDPDDVTRQGIQQAGGDCHFYGAPVLPGAMFMTADIDNIPVIGVPACGLYHETTLLDLVLPRILAGERLDRRDIAGMGHGGLCLNCPECHFPHCPFGKCA
jgi:hypothetical protein